MKNAVLDAIFTRSSIRAYTPEKLTNEELDALKQAALASPTARNSQLQRYYFITCDKLNREIEQAVVDTMIAQGEYPAEKRDKCKGAVLFEAPLLVVIAVRSDNSWGEVDAGIAVENLAIAAKSMGLDLSLIHI